VSGTDAVKTRISALLERLFRERGLQIEKIVLFGSRASGGFGEDSDIDIVIVSRDFRNKSVFERVRLTTGIGRELVRLLKVPFDLIYCSDDEWDEKDHLLINEAKEHGEILYTR